VIPLAIEPSIPHGLPDQYLDCLTIQDIQQRGNEESIAITLVGIQARDRDDRGPT